MSGTQRKPMHEPSSGEDGDIAGDTRKAEERGIMKIFSIMEFDRIGDELAELLALMEKGRVKAPPLTTYPLADGPKALQHMKDGRVRGKIILKMNDAT